MIQAFRKKLELDLAVEFQKEFFFPDTGFNVLNQERFRKEVLEKMRERGWILTVFAFKDTGDPDGWDDRMIIEFHDAQTDSSFFVLFQGLEDEMILTVLDQGLKSSPQKGS